MSFPAAPKQRPGEWALSAACRGADPDIFFPERGDLAEPALVVCRRCPVRQECLDFAISNREKVGIWGGLTAEDRRQMVRARRARKAVGQ